MPRAMPGTATTPKACLHPQCSAMNAPIISPSGAPSHMEAGIAAHTLALSLRGKLADRRVCPAGL